MIPFVETLAKPHTHYVEIAEHLFTADPASLQNNYTSNDAIKANIYRRRLHEDGFPWSDDFKKMRLSASKRHKFS